MISDLVLLAELPDSIKYSVEAYIGCIGGAMLKDEYVEAIRAAGFRDVRILQEASFPLEHLANDQTLKVIMEDPNLPLEELRKIPTSVVSARISGGKRKGPSLF